MVARGWILSALAVLAGIALWWGLAGRFDNQDPPPALPDIALKTLGGEPAPLHDFLGRPVVMNLWATWCVPCRREMPLLQAAQKRHGGIDFVFVNVGESSPTITAYLQEDELELANVLRDPGGAISRYFGVSGMPTTLFFDATGVLLHSHAGELSPEMLDRYIVDLRQAAEPAVSQ